MHFKLQGEFDFKFDGSIQSIFQFHEKKERKKNAQHCPNAKVNISFLFELMHNIDG